MDIQNLLAELRAEFSRINHAITVLEGLYSSPPRRGRPPKSKISAPTPSKKRPTMSAAARKRISEAMKQRWVKWKGKSAPKQVKAAPKKPSRRPHMSAAAKKRLSELMKARWAERKRAKP